ncbi:MAG TPA: helix-turn-helix domain-containing protein [Burkholderiales bacterium]|nr:helix-turn-helix domain-containing protein [Burkholderiales bacterium]
MSEAEPATERASPGKALAAARTELKLSVGDVSQQIKYGVKQIAAIESDDYAKLPGTTFVRGMIRSYAKLVQIDPEPLLVDLGRRDIPAAATVDLRTSRQEPFIEGGGKSNRIYVSLSIAALVAVAVVVYEWQINPLDTGQVVTITPKGASETAPAPPAAPAPAPASAPSTPQAGAPSTAQASTPSAPEPASTPSSPAPASATDSAGATAVEVAQHPAQTAAPAAAASESVIPKKRIELTFAQLSWVEVKQADGKILLSQLNQPGTSKVIEGVPPFEIVIGNAANVRLTYNDAPVDLRPYVKVDVARLKLE